MQQSPDHTSPSSTPTDPRIHPVPPDEIIRLFEQSSVAIGMLKGKDMVISAGNDAMFRIWGLNKDAQGKKLADVLPSVMKEGFGEILCSVFETGISYSDYEYQIYLQRDGAPYEAYYTFNYSPYFDMDGQTAGVIVNAVEVTPRALLNKRVAKSEADYRRLIENSPVAMYACDKDGFITQSNRAATELFGHALEPGLDRWTGAWKIAGEDGLFIAPDQSPMAIALKTGRIPEQQELTLHNIDGTVRVIIDHPQLFQTDAGEITGGLNVVIDITERKLAERNTARLAAIIHTTDDAIISKNLEGIITSWNPAAEKLFGYKEEEVIGTPITRLFPADRKDEEPLILERIMRGERIEHFDTIRIKKNGEPIDISLTISPIKNSAGKIIGASKIARDITVRKVLYKAMQESEHKFRELVMQAPVGITILKGKDLIVELANDTYLQIVDRTREEFTGKSLFQSLPEVRSAVEPLLMRILETGVPYYGNEFCVNIKRHGRIDTAYFNFVYQPLKEPDGHISGITVVANEVTEQVEARHALAESEKEFRRMVMQSPIAMTIFRGPEFIIEVANIEMLANIWRRAEKDVIGHKALEVFPELNNQKYPALLRHVMETEKVYRENESLAFVQGAHELRKFYLDFEYAPLFETDGSISGIMVTVNDVTEKVEARQKVEDAEARLRLAAEGTGLATWDLNLVTHEIIYTPRLAEIFGYDRNQQQVSFDNLRSRFLEEDVKTIVSPAFRAAMETGTYYYEARVLWPDKSIHWIRTHGTVIYDQQGRPLRMLGTVQDATEQKNASRILEESEQRLNIALEATELGTWELNLHTRQATYSSRYLQILGFKPHEHPEHAELLQRIHPDDRIKRDHAMAEALKTGRLDLEMRIVQPGKELRWIKARGKLFYNKEGSAERMMGTLQDITDQKMAFIALQESEERFKIVADSAPVMIWMSGSDRFLDFFNTTWLNFTGHTIDEERKDGWQKSVHPADLQRTVDLYNDAFDKQIPFYTEYRLLRHDGVYRWISDNAVPRYAHGEFIGFISACMDIDDEKKFNERLQQSELLFKTISNVSPVGLWMTDETGVNTFVNDTWIRWTGIKQLGNEHGWFHSLLEADREVVAHIFQRKLAMRDKFALEFRFKRTDGSVRWAFSEGYPYYDQAGNFAGYAGSVTDITDRKQDEIRKNEFLAVASHELKTPITSIKAYTQLLAQTYQHTDDALLKNALAKVENQVNKMSKLVGDFLNLSKIEADKVLLQKEPVALNELVREAVSDMQLVSPGYVITLHVPAEPVWVNADREKIMQVLTNMLNNAVKYSLDEKEIKLTLTREDNEATVTIEDKGIGIRPGEYEKIFERFYRADPNNIRVSGFGIGLYISAEIIRRHGGQIGVKGNKGKGSSFYFKLPAVEK